MDTIKCNIINFIKDKRLVKNVDVMHHFNMTASGVKNHMNYLLSVGIIIQNDDKIIKIGDGDLHTNVYEYIKEKRYCDLHELHTIFNIKKAKLPCLLRGYFADNRLKKLTNNIQTIYYSPTDTELSEKQLLPVLNAYKKPAIITFSEFIADFPIGADDYSLLRKFHTRPLLTKYNPYL